MSDFQSLLTHDFKRRQTAKKPRQFRAFEKQSAVADTLTGVTTGCQMSAALVHVKTPFEPQHNQLGAPVDRHSTTSRSLALVHDWLEAPGGGEGGLASLRHLFPGAPVFTLVDFLSDDERSRFRFARVHTSFLQHAPLARHWFRYAAALAPSVVERFDTAPFDIVISDSHAVAKGIRRRPGQLHICYCHTPARFAWTMASTYADRAARTQPLNRSLALRAQSRFRAWDVAASRRVDDFVANSHHVAALIARCYSRSATVIYPPVDVERFASTGHQSTRSGYVTISRLVPYKRIDVLIDAFRALPDRVLTIIGDGPERAHLSRNLPRNVRMLGRVDDATAAAELGRAQAFVFAADEDFGIATAEAQAAGTPVIAYRAGGSAEIVVDVESSSSPTGVLFEAQTPPALIRAIERFERTTIEPAACRENAARFSRRRFEAQFKAHFESVVEERVRKRDA
jgi:glycosyltransferase involved in cell wall biosynthesis